MSKYKQSLHFVAEGDGYQLFTDGRGQLIRIYEAAPERKGSYQTLLDRIGELSAPRHLSFEHLEAR